VQARKGDGSVKTKTHLNILLTALVILTVIPACIFTTSPESSTQPAGDSTSVIPDGEPQAPVDFGTIGFTLDTARQTSGTFDFMSGEGLILTAADANGYGWMLSIPADALLSNTEIKMTPFATLDVSQSEAKIISGVQLEPDGLQFVDEVRLSVTVPGDNPGVGLIFSFQEDGSEVAFASTVNTSGGKTAIATIWHFSSAGYAGGDSGDDPGGYRQMAEQEYRWALAAAKLFIQNGAPTPPTPPVISQFCRGTEVNPEEPIQADIFEFGRTFLDPYTEINSILLAAMKAMELVGAGEDTSAGADAAQQIAKMAETSIWQLGTQVEGERPPDRLYAVVFVALSVERQVELLGSSSDMLLVITGWAETIRDYYLTQLETNHDYRAWPILLTLERYTQILGGMDRLGDIMSAMTFEVIVDTSFEGTWYSGEELFATGNVVQNADVKDITNQLSPPNFLWGTANNMTLKAKSGNFSDSTGSYPLAGQEDPATLWLLNWDACVTKTFDVMLTGFYGDGQNKSATVAGAASMVSLEQYWWTGAGAFMFTVPMQNLNPNLGDGTYSGSGSAADGDFNGSAQIHIVIKHTP
jgi:hypothetical protein